MGRRRTQNRAARASFCQALKLLPLVANDRSSGAGEVGPLMRACRRPVLPGPPRATPAPCETALLLPSLSPPTPRRRRAAVTLPPRACRRSVADPSRLVRHTRNFRNFGPAGGISAPSGQPFPIGPPLSPRRRRRARSRRPAPPPPRHAPDGAARNAAPGTPRLPTAAIRPECRASPPRPVPARRGRRAAR